MRDIFDMIFPQNAGGFLEQILSIPFFDFGGSHQIGKGVRDWNKPKGKWSGEDIRGFNARNGVGSSKRRTHP